MFPNIPLAAWADRETRILKMEQKFSTQPLLRAAPPCRPWYAPSDTTTPNSVRNVVAPTWSQTPVDQPLDLSLSRKRNSECDILLGGDSPIDLSVKKTRSTNHHVEPSPMPQLDLKTWPLNFKDPMTLVGRQLATAPSLGKAAEHLIESDQSKLSNYAASLIRTVAKEQAGCGGGLASKEVVIVNKTKGESMKEGASVERPIVISPSADHLEGIKSDVPLIASHSHLYSGLPSLAKISDLSEGEESRVGGDDAPKPGPRLFDRTQQIKRIPVANVQPFMKNCDNESLRGQFSESEASRAARASKEAFGWNTPHHMEFVKFISQSRMPDTRPTVVESAVNQVVNQVELKTAQPAEAVRAVESEERYAVEPESEMIVTVEEANGMESSRNAKEGLELFGVSEVLKIKRKYSKKSDTPDTRPLNKIKISKSKISLNIGDSQNVSFVDKYAISAGVNDMSCSSSDGASDVTSSVESSASSSKGWRIKGSRKLVPFKEVMKLNENEDCNISPSPKNSIFKTPKSANNKFFGFYKSPLSGVKRRLSKKFKEVAEEGEERGESPLEAGEVKKVGESRLHIAVRDGDEELVNLYLLDGSIHANVQDNMGVTPLHISCSKGNFSISKTLLLQGAHPHAKALDETRPIHKAVESGNVHVVRLLLSFGANIDVLNCYGEPLIQMAKHKLMRNFLKACKSDISDEIDTENEFLWELPTSFQDCDLMEGAPEDDPTSAPQTLLITQIEDTHLLANSELCIPFGKLKFEKCDESREPSHPLPHLVDTKNLTKIISTFSTSVHLA